MGDTTTMHTAMSIPTNRARTTIRMMHTTTDIPTKRIRTTMHTNMGIHMMHIRMSHVRTTIRTMRTSMSMHTMLLLTAILTTAMHMKAKRPNL